MYDSLGLAYIVSHITFYDRLARLASKEPRDAASRASTANSDEEGDGPLREALVGLYTAVLNYLIIVLALSHGPRETRAQQQKQKTWDRPGVDMDSAALHPIIVLESSLGQHAGDKELEESITELVRLRATPVALPDRVDGDAEETGEITNSTIMASDDNSNNRNKDDDDGDDDDSDADDDNFSDRDHSDDSEDDNGSNKDRSIDNDSRRDNGDCELNALDSEIQKQLCVTPVQPPSFPPRPPPQQDGSPSVLSSLYGWAMKQDAYRRWCHARRLPFGNHISHTEDADDVNHASDLDQDSRILWLCGPAGASATLLLHALAEGERNRQDGDGGARLPRHTVAHAFWDWSRDLHGMSVVSVLRDLLWTLLAAQPAMRNHVAQAIKATGRRPLLGGSSIDGDNDNNNSNNFTEAQYAALGTSSDFYSLLALLCRIVSDPEFEPTCFVVDHMDVPSGDDDDLDGDNDEGEDMQAYKYGRSSPGSTAQKRAWTFRDLVALMRTTCRLSGKVTWMVASSLSSSPSSPNNCCLHLKPEDSTLGQIVYSYVRALSRSRLKAHMPDMLGQLESELARRAGGNVAWIHLAVDVLAAVRLPWNAVRVLQRLPESNKGLGQLLDWVVQDSVSDSASDRAHVDALLYAAALAFRPLSVAELAALAELPATVDAAILIKALVPSLLKLQEIDDEGGRQKYAYFSSRALLVAQRARLAKDMSAPQRHVKLHADMACRHLRCLMRHYHAAHAARTNKDDGKEAGGDQLSLYMKFAWLRHLDRVGIGRPDDTDSPLTDEVCRFVKQYASTWLRDLEALDVLAVAHGLLQDLLISIPEPLSPMEAALQSLFTSIVRQQTVHLSLTKTDRFLRMTGLKADDIDENEFDDMPVRPQDPPIPLPEIQSLTSPEMAKEAAAITTLAGHTDWVRDVHWACGGRLIVSISDDETLRCYDRASSRVQHVASHKLPGYPERLAVSPTDPCMLIAIDSLNIVYLDLAAGGVVITNRSRDEIVGEMRAQTQHVQLNEEGVSDPSNTSETRQAAGEPEHIPFFTGVRFIEDGTGDVVITCEDNDDQPLQVVLAMPALRWKRLWRMERDIQSLPEKTSTSECVATAVAPASRLAALLRDDGDLCIHDTGSGALVQTLRDTRRRFTTVEYDIFRHMFVTRDRSGWPAFHVLRDREERSTTGSLIRSYWVPTELSATSYSFSPNHDEIIMGFRTSPAEIYKVIESGVDCVVRDNGGANNVRSNANSTGNTTIQRLHRPTATAFSNEGSRVAMANEDGEIHLWNINISVHGASHASDPTFWLTMRGGRSEVNWLSFSSDDALLLACLDNGQTDVWDLNTGGRVAILGGHSSWVFFAAFSPDDKLVATASEDGLLRLWDLATCRAMYLETGGDMDSLFRDDDSKSNRSTSDESMPDDMSDDKDENKSEDKDKDDSNDKTNGNGDDEETTPATKRIFISLKDTNIDVDGTVAFSPDSRFLATSGYISHIWDISPAPGSDTVLPAEPVKPCATLSWAHVASQKQERSNESNDDDDDDDDNDDHDDHSGHNTANSLIFFSFAFSPDGRSLFGFWEDGQLLVWTRRGSVSDDRDDCDDRWQPSPTILAHGFEVPGHDTLWAHCPRRLSVSVGMEGQYLLHSEIGVWELPSTPLPTNADVGDDENVQKVGLRSSPQHPCSVVHDGAHVAVLWQNQLVAQLPKVFAPYEPYSFSSYTCAVYDGTTLLVCTREARLLCFRFQGKETKATDRMDRMDRMDTPKDEISKLHEGDETDETRETYEVDKTNEGNA